MSRTDPLVVAGDPVKGPASFTRFVLPFAYQLCQAEACQSSGWEENPSSASVDRRRYFTPETSLVLFERAKWFKAAHLPDRWSRLRVYRGARELQVRLAPPELVLFEGATRPKSKAPPDPDPLQTGMLIVEAHFEDENSCAAWTLDDLLQFNELFRYWQPPWTEDSYASPHCKKVFGRECRLQSSYPEFLRNAVVDRNGTSIANVQNASESNAGFALYLKRWSWLLDAPVRLRDGTSFWLFPDCQEREVGVSRSPDAGTQPSWAIHADPRTFVWTCALVEGGLDALQGPRSNVASADPQWLRLVNVDPPDQSDANPFEVEWIRKRTYDRWADAGTLYGFSFHSGAMLGSACLDPPTWRHFGDMYFDQALLLLYLRTCTFRFSKSLSEAAATARDKGDMRPEDFAVLREKFVQFTVLYQFPLISNQQQGIEMYSKQRKLMDVGELFREVQQEIESNQEFTENQTQTEIAKVGVFLAVIATFGLAAGLVLSFFGMSFLIDEMTKSLTRQRQFALALGAPILAGLLALASVWTIWKVWRTRRGSNTGKQRG